MPGGVEAEPEAEPIGDFEVDGLMGSQPMICMVWTVWPTMMTRMATIMKPVRMSILRWGIFDNVRTINIRRDEKLKKQAKKDLKVGKLKVYDSAEEMHRDLLSDD